LTLETAFESLKAIFLKFEKKIIFRELAQKILEKKDFNFFPQSKN